jgi:hypothetical protein
VGFLFLCKRFRDYEAGFHLFLPPLTAMILPVMNEALFESRERNGVGDFFRSTAQEADRRHSLLLRVSRAAMPPQKHQPT